MVKEPQYPPTPKQNVHTAACLMISCHFVQQFLSTEIHYTLDYLETLLTTWLLQQINDLWKIASSFISQPRTLNITVQCYFTNLSVTIFPWALLTMARQCCQTITTNTGTAYWVFLTVTGHSLNCPTLTVIVDNSLAVSTTPDFNIFS